MDRNFFPLFCLLPTFVALRKESVDRNFWAGSRMVTLIPSLSARRAWIEIRSPGWCRCGRWSSLSARRAWIEIQAILVKVVDFPSLSARRAWIEITQPPAAPTLADRRSPQGERG